MGWAFKVLPGKAVDELEYELTALRAADAVVSSWLDVSARGLRLDKARNKIEDPGVALRRANAKFEQRFRAMEVLAAAEGRAFDTLALAEQEALWVRVKQAR